MRADSALAWLAWRARRAEQTNKAFDDNVWPLVDYLETNGLSLEDWIESAPCAPAHVEFAAGYLIAVAEMNHATQEEVLRAAGVECPLGRQRIGR